MNDENAPLGMHWRLDEGRLVATWCCGAETWCCGAETWCCGAETWCCGPEQSSVVESAAVESAATAPRRTSSRVERYAFALASESSRYTPLGPGFSR